MKLEKLFHRRPRNDEMAMYPLDTRDLHSHAATSILPMGATLDASESDVSMTSSDEEDEQVQAKMPDLTRCEVDDCGNPVFHRDIRMCATHGGGKTCSERGCENMARSRGLCPSHGGGTRCSTHGCSKHVVSSGKCVAHGGGRRCKTPNCTSSAVSRGLCVLHGGGRKCKHDGCTKHVASGGLCRAHGGGRRCKMDGCISSAQSRGLCYVHGGGGRCQMPGCSSSAKKGGYCIAHGGGHRCSVPNCKSSAVSGDLCRAHGGGKRCSVADCKSSAKTGGLCIAHGGGKRCTVDGCKSSAQRMGLCKAHGGGRKCSADGCTNSAVSRGKCIAHGGGKRCVSEGCSTTARKGGYCFAHGGRSNSVSSTASTCASRAATPQLTPVASTRPLVRDALSIATLSPLPSLRLPGPLPPVSMLTSQQKENTIRHSEVPPLRSIPDHRRRPTLSATALWPPNISTLMLDDEGSSSSLPCSPLDTSPSPKPPGYSWQKLQETIRRESKDYGIVDEDEEDIKTEVEAQENDQSAKDDGAKPSKSFSMLISAVLCK